MADRFAALAGYDATSAYDSTIEQSTTQQHNDDLADLDTEPSLNLNISSTQAFSHITQRRKPSLAADKARRTTLVPSNLQPSVIPEEAATPQHKANPKRTNEPPSTQTKPDSRRRYGVKIADDDTLDDVQDSFETSGNEELEKMQAELYDDFDSMMASPRENDSGQWGARAMRRRSAAGVSMKSAQEKINGLTQERDELKIVVDLLREKVSLDDRLAELIVLKKEKLTYTNKLIAQQAMLKQQDKAIKVLQKEQQAWKGRDPVEVEKQMADLQAQLHAANARADQQHRERLRAEDEIDFIKKRGGSAHLDASIQSSDVGNTTRFQQEMDVLKDDHADQMYHIRQERDALQDQLDQLKSGQTSSGNHSIATRQKEAEYQREIDDLEQQLTAQKVQNERIQERQAELHAEIEQHKDEIYELKSSEEALQRELEVAKQKLEHSNMTQEDDALRFQEAEHLAAERTQEQQDKLRDALTAAQLRLDEKEAEAERLDTEVQEQLAKVADLEYELRQSQGVIEEQREQLEGVEAEADELDRQLQAYKEEAGVCKEEIQALQKELEAKELDLAETNKEVQEMSNRVYSLEEELEVRIEEIKQLDQEVAKAEDALKEANERNERHTLVLKEKLSAISLEFSEAQSQLEIAVTELEAARDEADAYARDVEHLTNERAQLEEINAKLDSKISDVVEDLKAEERALDEANAEWERKLDATEDRLSRMIQEKEEAVNSLENEIQGLERDLNTSKEDVEKLQVALRSKENESLRLGQSQANDRYSLELEIDRLKRDLARCESDLERTRKELERKEDALREKDNSLSKLHEQLRQVSATLASETQDRLGLLERFEAQQRTLADERRELDASRMRIEELDHKLNDGTKANIESEQHTRNSLTERNTLLLTIYQYMGKILVGTESGATPRKKESDAKPFTNFEVFHDSLLARLRKISDIQSSFEQRSKDVEAKLSDKFNNLKRQQDTRFRQIDRFEAAIKSATEKQAQWRLRVVSKQNELESVKATNAELLQQISSLKTRSSLSNPSDNSKLTTLTSRANNAERRLSLAQSQALQAEERLTEAKQKYGQGEGKWVARIKELEIRVKEAEERVKRERQGAKERVADLTEQMRRLQKDVATAEKRNKQLGEIQHAIEGVE